MNKVGRERAGLFHSVDCGAPVNVHILPQRPNLLTFSRFVRVTKENTLNSGDELLLMLLAIRLNNWESQKRGPYNSSHMLLGVGLCNIKPALTNAPFFRHFCLDKQRNTALWNGAANELGASREPILDIPGASEEISNTTKRLDARVRSLPLQSIKSNTYHMGQVGSHLVPHIRIADFSKTQLPLDLFPCSDESDTVHSSHNLPTISTRASPLRLVAHSLFDHLPCNLPLKHNGKFITFLRRLAQFCLHHFGDVRVHVASSVRHVQIYLAGTLNIASKRGIMLQPIAGSILMDRQARLIHERVGRLECVSEFHAGSKALPCIIRLEPPSLSIQWAHRRGIYIIQVIHRVLLAFVKSSFVEPRENGQVD